MSPKPSNQKSFQIVGWLLFIASALCFTVSTWGNGDIPGTVGSLLFLIACFVFLWPLLRA
ncbi:cytochrome oxidase subunit III [Leptolyngbya iicbica LK]|uniref:Cytochrome oxidase subunit III n=1 Tax=Leptolyngbya iicbica LK TaxID=2294035 RepID=A0A4Q7E6W1_9CYAN|nr:cytochrome oxidase subunit III [Leptolyngbya sp. LK]